MLGFLEIIIEGIARNSHTVNSPRVFLTQIVTVSRAMLDAIPRFLGFDRTFFFTEQTCNVVTFELVNIVSLSSCGNIHPVRIIFDSEANIVSLAFFENGFMVRNKLIDRIRIFRCETVQVLSIWVRDYSIVCNNKSRCSM